MHEIRYSADFNGDYIKLRKRADSNDGESRYLIELISKATAKLAENSEAGSKIPHKLWPKEYTQKYDARNLWKYDLDRNWRLIYTIAGNQVQIFLIYLECMNHKDYERKFGYKRS
jgi:mRNA-degrading endonuclease YafQ of YafQ-DinJ toxin-antitoxin module